MDRVTGEEWLVSKVGAYLPGVFEEVLDTINAYVLTEKDALHLRAIRSHTDDFGSKRRTGEEWLVTQEKTETYIPSVHTHVVALVTITTLTNLQYAVIINPVDSAGRSQLGAKKLVKGERVENGAQHACCARLGGGGGRAPRGVDRGFLPRGCAGPAAFFLQPGEILEKGVQDVFILGEDEGLILRAMETFVDTFEGKEVHRVPGTFR